MTATCCRCKKPMTLDPYLAARLTPGAVALHAACAREGHREVRAMLDAAQARAYQALPPEYARHATKISPGEYAAVYARHKAGERHCDIAPDYGVHQTTVGDVCRRMADEEASRG